MKHILIQCGTLILIQVCVTFAAPSEDIPILKHGQYAPDVFKEYDLVELIQLVYQAAPKLVEESLIDLGGDIWSQEDIVEQVIDPLQNAVGDLLRNDTSCTLCKILVGIMRGRALLGEGNFTKLTENMIAICEKIAPQLEINGEVLCPGTLRLQMRHVYVVLSNKQNTVPEICGFLNLCLPDPLTNSKTPKKPVELQQKPVKQRTPSSKSRSVPPPDSLVVVQLTDIHVEPKYEQNTSVYCNLPVCCDPAWGPGPARSYGEYQCNIPQATIALFLEKVKTFNPDVILFSGDVPPHSMWDETPDSQIECSRTLVEIINATLPDYKVYPNIGNHEGYPTNLFSVRKMNPLYTPDFLKNFTDIWRPLADFDEENVDSVTKGGFYAKDVSDGLRLISFNTNYMYTFNWYNIDNHRIYRPTEVRPPYRSYASEYTNLTQFVEQELLNAETAGKKVILMGHHPPGGADYIVNGSRWYRELVLNYTDTIVLQPTGHTHYDEFRMIYDDAGTPRSVVLVSPSMSSGGRRNPSMRIYYLHNETKELLDYDQYYLNLGPIIYKQSNATADELITHLYSAKSNYSMDDLSPESWHQLLQSFEQDPAKLDLHRRLRQADAQTSLGFCEWRCQNNYICRLKNVNYDEYKDCAISLSEMTRTTRTKPTQPTPPTIDSAPSHHSITAATLFISALILSLIH